MQNNIVTNSNAVIIYECNQTAVRIEAKTGLKVRIFAEYVDGVNNIINKKDWQIEVLKNYIASYYKLPWKTITSLAKHERVKVARWAFCHVALELHINKSAVGKLVNRDHTTIINTIKKISFDLAAGLPYALEIITLPNLFTTHLNKIYEEAKNKPNPQPTKRFNYVATCTGSGVLQ